MALFVYIDRPDLPPLYVANATADTLLTFDRAQARRFRNALNAAQHKALWLNTMARLGFADFSLASEPAD